MGEVCSMPDCYEENTLYRIGNLLFCRKHLEEPVMTAYYLAKSIEAKEAT